MTNKKSSFLMRWMLSPLEVIAIVVVSTFTAGAFFLSIRDAVQLEQTLNLNLTQSLIVYQGIVNLQREAQLTHQEVLRLLGDLDSPPKPITRMDFLEVQVNNLVKESEAPSREYTFTPEAISLVQSIESRAVTIEGFISDLQQAEAPDRQTAVLIELDHRLDELEVMLKQLIDLQATAQRSAIVQTRDSLSASQLTTFIAGGVLLLLGTALAFVFRQTLSARLRRALEADQLKDQLLANVSHELRTPITAIQGYTQLLDDGTYGELTDKQKNTIQRILINTTQLKGMVNNLLDSAQIEQGKLALRNIPFAPAELVKNVHAALNILAATKELNLTSEISPEVPETINGDLMRLQQILFNLVSNAIKFTESGSVHMHIFLPEKGHWALQVIDTGIGIPAEKQTFVFEPFWQIDNSLTRQYRGSGLGLSIVKQLVDLMGGALTLTSQPGKGSAFTVVFPMEHQ